MSIKFFGPPVGQAPPEGVLGASRVPHQRWPTSGNPATPCNCAVATRPRAWRAARRRFAKFAHPSRCVCLTTGVKLRGPEGAQRLRATSASTSELCRCTCAGPGSLREAPDLLAGSRWFRVAAGSGGGRRHRAANRAVRSRRRARRAVARRAVACVVRTRRAVACVVRAGASCGRSMGSA
jgi:hypothetical protein